MKANEVTLEKWHEDEKVWWNKYGNYMTYQWRLTPALNKILRAELEEDYTKFLLHSNGSLLDLGCGGGWLSSHFAELGMQVLGVDLSQEQINDANLLKTLRSLNNVEFECCDLIQWDSGKHKSKFDGIFVNAFLHHLPEFELEILFNKIAEVLKTGGKVYMYEPLRAPSGERRFFAQFLDFLYKLMMYVLMSVLPKSLGLFNDRHKAQIKNGYQMCSPHERPVDIDVIRKCCSNSFEILEIKGWHLFSMGFAMQAMGLKGYVRTIYTPISALLFWLDKMVFRIFEWSVFSKPQRFILCSIKLARK